jgi:hypothetical protein
MRDFELSAYKSKKFISFKIDRRAELNPNLSHVGLREMIKRYYHSMTVSTN